jgi:AcrR family transcriptional regulator
VTTAPKPKQNRAARGGPNPKRPAPKQKRPYHHGDLARALVAAAEELLAERGPEGFTLRECARRAGVSHAAPAHHFGDITGLLTEVAVVGFERLTENTRRARESATGGPADQLFSILCAYVETAVAHPATFRLMFASDRIERGGKLAESGAEAYRVLVETVQSVAKAAGRPAPSPYSPDVTLAWSAVHGFASLIVEKRLEHGTAIEYGGDWRARRDAVLRLFVRNFAGNGT